MINIGMGAAELGIESDIVFPHWRGDKTAWKTSTLCEHPRKQQYDYAMVYTSAMLFKNVAGNRNFLMGFCQRDLNELSKWGGTAQLVCPYKGLVKHFQAITPLPVLYLPPLFPMPTISTSFLPCNYAPKGPIKILAIDSTHVPDQTEWKWREMRIIIKTIGGNVRAVVNERQDISQMKLADHVEYIRAPMPFKSLYDEVMASDIIVARDDGNGGSMIHDFVSLGKPLFLVTQRRNNTSWCYSPVYENEDHIFFYGESEDSVVKKVDLFMNNLPVHEKSLQDCMRDHELSTWVKYAEKVFT